jgi:ribonuclease HI
MEYANIYIETSTRGPTKRDYGIGMWLVDIGKDGVPDTKDGTVHGEDTDETQLALMALTNALTVVNRLEERTGKTYARLVVTHAGEVLSAMNNGWYKRWQQDGWINSKGKPIRSEWQKVADAVNNHECQCREGIHEYQIWMENSIKEEFEGWKREKEHK